MTHTDRFNDVEEARRRFAQEQGRPWTRLPREEWEVIDRALRKPAHDPATCGFCAIEANGGVAPGEEQT